MMSLTKILPAPTHAVHDRSDVEATMPIKQDFQVMAVNMAPPYGHRRGWIPRVQDDFGDGGSFPEIHVAQYPLDMGKEKNQGNALALTLDTQGKIRYDALARIGHSKDRIVHSRFGDLLPKIMDESDPALARPDEETIEDTAERTRAALDRLVEAKVAASAPIRRAEATAPAQYIRYTPSQQGQAYNSGAKQRVIRMVESQSDPMDPPKFKINQKIPRGPPSPPPPVMHSPTRKVTVKEQQEWKIPPCISNWKNPKGYTIPLDKRVAADGRGLQTVHINENFAKLAEALYIVDRKAREAVEMRAQIDRKIAQKEKEKREEELRRIAQRAREERAGFRTSAAGSATTAPIASSSEGGAEDEARDRDDLRRDRARDRARDRNLARAGADTKNRVLRERDRDISEKIALGLPGRGGSAAAGGVDAQFDSRLFNQTKGLDSGFNAGDDEMYNVYDKPWRGDREAAQHLYRPGRSAGGQAVDDDGNGYAEELDRLSKARRFVPDREFSGTNRSAAAGARSEGPVQFERDQEEDPFGLNDFLRQVKTGGGGGGTASGGGKRAAGAVNADEDMASNTRNKRERR